MAAVFRSFFSKLLFCFAFSLSSPLMATEYYVGLDAFLLDYEIHFGESEAYDLIPARLKFGMLDEKSGKGFEIHALTSSDDAITNRNNLKSSVEFENNFGVFYKHLSSSRQFYFLAGFTRLNTVYSITQPNGAKTSDSSGVTSLAIGFGGQYRLLSNLYASIDYLHFQANSVSHNTFFSEEPELNSGGFGIGLNYTF